MTEAQLWTLPSTLGWSPHQSLRDGPTSSLWSDHYTIRPLMPSLPTLSIKGQNLKEATAPSCGGFQGGTGSARRLQPELPALNSGPVSY